MFNNYFWHGINTSLIFLVFMYVFLSKDINTRAYDKAVEVEKRVDNQKKIIEALSTQKDTIVVNVKNYNHYNHYEKNSK